MTDMYLEDQLQKVYTLIRDKGWNPYEGKPIERVEEIVSRGPALRLKSGSSYLILPEVKNASNFSEVEIRQNENEEEEIFPIFYQREKPINISFINFDDNGMRVFHDNQKFLYWAVLYLLKSLEKSPIFPSFT